MIYGSVCSGIEAATAAWHHLGWKPSFFSEIENFPRAVLAHHYPDVPLHGDFTTIGANQYEPINLLVGGTPCQSFSLAGLRGGLDDDRGNLALEFLRLAQRTRPKWLVWENVSGVLSSNGGRDFGSILGGMVKCGYGIAYRVLDAQYFGVAQRRRRVFVIGCLGDTASAAAVLFERHSLQGHSAPSREKGQENTATLRTRAPASGGQGTDFEHVVAHTLTARSGASMNAPDYQTYLPVSCPAKVAPTLTCDFAAKHGQNNQHINGGAGLFVPDVCMAFAHQQGGSIDMHTRKDCGLTLQRSQQQAVQIKSAVRRLTPRECERLQGFSDDFTRIPYRNKPADQCPDGPRYKALGNSMAVPVMRWIGERIQMIDELHD
jgi:DNA (cytosine-5)-methyltransferase 1